ncbi:hypothetical protein JTB14_037794 [Gonioctena quinquepunctata]|nr:hypothetical protein JTB14_037794 [Gonioctena quinquepunctata]
MTLLERKIAHHSQVRGKTGRERRSIEHQGWIPPPTIIPIPTCLNLSLLSQGSPSASVNRMCVVEKCPSLCFWMAPGQADNRNLISQWKMWQSRFRKLNYYLDKQAGVK